MEYLTGNSKTKVRMIVTWRTDTLMYHPLGSMGVWMHLAERPQTFLKLLNTRNIPFLAGHYSNHVIGAVTGLTVGKTIDTGYLNGMANIVLHNDPLSREIYEKQIKTGRCRAISAAISWSDALPHFCRETGRCIFDVIDYEVRELSLVQEGRDSGARIECFWEEEIGKHEVIPGSDVSFPLLGKSSEKPIVTPVGVGHGYAAAA